MDEKKLIEAIEHYTGKKYEPVDIPEEELERQWRAFVEPLQRVAQSDGTENFSTPIEKF